MKIAIHTVDNKLPSWVYAGVADYQKRFKRFSNYALEIKEIQQEKRSQKSIDACIDAESDALIKSLPKTNATVIALDVTGKRYDTEGLAAKIKELSTESLPLIFLIGGADGFNDKVRAVADTRMSLSDLTLPHALARLFLVEAIYRAVSVNHHLPYHRA